MEEVNKIPTGSIMAIENKPGGGGTKKLPMVEPDNVDLGDE